METPLWSSKWLNAEDAAALDSFIKQEHELLKCYNLMTKDELIRELMLIEMSEAASAAIAQETLSEFVQKNPGMVAAIEQRQAMTQKEIATRLQNRTVN